MKNPLLQKSNEKPGKYCQNQLFSELWKLTESLKQSREYCTKSISWILIKNNNNYDLCGFSSLTLLLSNS
jgi:hypothetical protein